MKIVDLIRNISEISERKSRGTSPDSTSISDVKLVDGLPFDLHTDATRYCVVVRTALICTFSCPVTLLER